jgi:hypothetical protein
VLATNALLAQNPILPVTHQLGRSFFLPAIITTAPLYTLRYKPTEIPLETDSFDNLNPDEIERIPWVRFHKTLTVAPRETLSGRGQAFGRPAYDRHHAPHAEVSELRADLKPPSTATWA